MIDDQPHLALLIDSDNMSAQHLPAMLVELAAHGSVTVRRAYGDWTTSQLGGWKDHLLEHAITPMQQFAYTVGKNATDSTLIIDAMDLLYSGNVEGFVIVSSDSDFTPLATRLRESGKVVIGVGQRKTPEAFRVACNQFIYVENLDPVTHPAAETAEATDESRLTPGRMQSLITKALANTAKDDGWSRLGPIGNFLRQARPDFDPRDYGFAKLGELVASLPYVEVRTSGTGPGGGQLWVRPKGARPAAKTAVKKAPAKKAAAKKSQASAGGA